jgi:hypothetical protein
LRAYLKPANAVPADRLSRLVAELGGSDSAVSAQATRELEAAGEQAEVALRRALALTSSPEQKQRLEQLLDELQAAAVSPERLWTTRALVVLEQLDTPEAREFLGELAQGAPVAWLTRQARAALERLARR